jgi:hypothetical protein
MRVERAEVLLGCVVWLVRIHSCGQMAAGTLSSFQTNALNPANLEYQDPCP